MLVHLDGPRFTCGFACLADNSNVNFDASVKSKEYVSLPIICTSTCSCPDNPKPLKPLVSMYCALNRGSSEITNDDLQIQAMYIHEQNRKREKAIPPQHSKNKEINYTCMYYILKVWILLSHICNQLALPNVSLAFCLFVLSTFILINYPPSPQTKQKRKMILRHFKFVTY